MNITCAGPHLNDVVLGTVLFPKDVNNPLNPAVLCSDCAAVYIQAINAPITIDDGRGNPIPNPDRVMPGQIPSAMIIQRRNQARDPNWTPPPHNYHAPS